MHGWTLWSPFNPFVFFDIILLFIVFPVFSRYAFVTCKVSTASTYHSSKGFTSQEKRESESGRNSNDMNFKQFRFSSCSVIKTGSKSMHFEIHIFINLFFFFGQLKNPLWAVMFVHPLDPMLVLFSSQTDLNHFGRLVPSDSGLSFIPFAPLRPQLQVSVFLALAVLFFA